jgi:hypothetical protein
MKPDICDIAVATGTILIVGGVWWIFAPAGMIAGGLVLCGMGWYGAASPKGTK